MCVCLEAELAKKKKGRQKNYQLSMRPFVFTVNSIPGIYRDKTNMRKKAHNLDGVFFQVLPNLLEQFLLHKVRNTRCDMGYK